MARDLRYTRYSVFAYARNCAGMGRRIDYGVVSIVVGPVQPNLVGLLPIGDMHLDITTIGLWARLRCNAHGLLPPVFRGHDAADVWRGDVRETGPTYVPGSCLVIRC